MPIGVYQGMGLGIELQRGMRDFCNGVSVLYVKCGDGYLDVYIFHNCALPTAYLKWVHFTICKYIPVKFECFLNVL